MEHHEDAAIARMRAIRRELKPSAIERLEVQCTEVETLLTLVLRPQERADTRRIVFTFHGVSDLSFGPGTFFPHLSLLEIDAIKDRQWEDKLYAVHNDEMDNGLTFYCRDFDVSIM